MNVKLLDKILLPFAQLRCSYFTAQVLWNSSVLLQVKEYDSAQ